MARALTAGRQICGDSIRPLLVLLWGLYLCVVTLAVGHWRCSAAWRYRSRVFRRCLLVCGRWAQY
jgi:hypothetical protein